MAIYVEKKPAIIRRGMRIRQADAVLVGVPHGKTASSLKGTALAPKAIFKQLEEQVEVRDILLKRETAKDVKIVARHLARVEKIEPICMAAEVYKSVINMMRQGKFVVGLGGEHTISLPFVSACREVYGPFTVVVIDAHLDLRDRTDDYETVRMDAGPDFGGKPGDQEIISRDIAHSTVMRRIHETAGGIPLVQIGIRSEDQSEFEYAEANKATIQVHRWPFCGNHQDIVNQIKTDQVYLSVDVDGFDPSVMPATGTTEEGGIAWDWFMRFAKDLFKKKKVVGMDLVEVLQGRKYCQLACSRTAYNAAKLIYHLIGLKFPE